MSRAIGANDGTPPSDRDFTELCRNAVVFGRGLRANGFRSQPDRTMLLAEALDVVGLRSRADARAAARAVFARNAEDSHRFDSAFDAVWSSSEAREGREERGGREPDGGPPRDKTTGDVIQGAPVVRTAAAAMDEARNPADKGDAEKRERLHAVDGDRSSTYAFAEGLYSKDFSRLTATELDRARELTKRQAWDLGRRMTRRMRRGRGGGIVDLAHTLRGSLRYGGEILSLETRVRRTKQRDLVLLCDISGSMDRYSRLLLQFVHTVRHAVGKVEAFVFGTRLTRITRQLRHREIHAALDDVAAYVVDWAGGTRIGESLHTFNQRWGRRVLSRGAVVVIISDGWDRGDIDLLAREMRRLQRSAYRLIWLNPLLGSAGYRPQTVGMAAALPFVDDFLPANNLKSLVQMAQLLQSVEHRRPTRAQSPWAS